MTSAKLDIDWKQLFLDALHKPAEVRDSYRWFHNFSFCNQLLAFLQACQRNLPLGPLNTYPGWKNLGRQVRKGERAIILQMPLISRKSAQDDEFKEQERVVFVFRPFWFLLSQTDGPPVALPQAPEWDRSRALEKLQIQLIEYDLLNGNNHGLARKRTIAINPVTPLPWHTFFHEVAHVLLHLSGEVQSRQLQEVEAEAVAYLVCHALHSDEDDNESRAYIQAFLGTDELPVASVRRVFAAVDRILRAGKPHAEDTRLIAPHAPPSRALQVA